MALYYVTAPDGTELEVEGPDGASQEEVIAQAQARYRPNPKFDPNSEEFKQKVAAQQLADRELYDPTKDMSTTEKLLAGAGKALSDTSMGARQLWNRATGDDEELKQLQAQTAEQRQLDRPLMDTKAGTVGDVGANIAMLAAPGGAMANAYKAGALSLPAIMAAEGATGAATGALAPTAGEGELKKNIIENAALNAAIPLAGKGVRALVGEADPARIVAAQRLRDLGVDVSKIQEIPGIVSNSTSALLKRMPIVGDTMRATESAQKEAAKKALFNILGTEVPVSNEGMKDIVDTVGQQIGSVTKAKAAPVANLASRVDDVLKNYQVSGKLRNSTVDQLAEEMKALSNIPNAKLKGQVYAQNRSAIGAAASSAEGPAKQALYGLQKALDDTFDESLSPAEKMTLDKARSNYRLALQLRKQDIKPGEGLDLYRARSDVERAAKKGAVNPKARKLLEDVALVIPKKTAPSETVQGASLGLSIMNPVIATKLAAVAGAPHALLKTGVPQKIANDPKSRRAIADALRAKIASETQED